MKYLVAFVFSICFFITGCGAVPYTKEEGRPIYSLTDAFGTKVDFYNLQVNTALGWLILTVGNYYIDNCFWGF